MIGHFKKEHQNGLPSTVRMEKQSLTLDCEARSFANAVDMKGWEFACFVCGKTTGTLMECEFGLNGGDHAVCSRSYHPSCAGLSEVPEGCFICPKVHLQHKNDGHSFDSFASQSAVSTVSNLLPTVPAAATASQAPAALLQKNQSLPRFYVVYRTKYQGGRPICQHEGGCPVTPSFGYPGEKSYIFCFQHRVAGMVSHVSRSVTSCLCVHCKKVLPLSEFSISQNQKKRSDRRCLSCQKGRPICQHEGGCPVSPSFGYSGEKSYIFCFQHRVAGMVCYKKKRNDRRCPSCTPRTRGQGLLCLLQQPVAIMLTLHSYRQ